MKQKGSWNLFVLFKSDDAALNGQHQPSFTSNTDKLAFITSITANLTFWFVLQQVLVAQLI